MGELAVRVRSLLRRPAVVDTVVAAVTAAVVLGPALFGSGFTLRGDMVFVPDQPWKPAWLGLDGSVPRSVPMDAVVWLLGQLLSGEVVQRSLLFLPLVAAGVGVGRLLHDTATVARLAGVVFAIWNPYVDERLGIGQWACVAGYAVLPWLVRAAARLREEEPGAAGRVVVLLAAAAVCAPSLGLVGVFVALCVVLARPRARTALVVAGAGLVVNLPWIVPSLLRPGLEASGGQFSDFAAVAESPAGVGASVLSLGGIWKSSVVPPERHSALLVVLTVALSAVAVLGLVAQARRHPRTTAGLAVAAGAAVLLAVLPAWSVVGSGLDAVARLVPGVGILRDSTRYLGPAVLAVAVGFGRAADVALTRARAAGAHPRMATALGGSFLVLPPLLLPSLAWGLHGFLRPEPYPAQWGEVAATLGRLEREHRGAVVVLPWRGSYRGFSWTDRHAVLDPAPRFFPGEVLVDDRIYLGSRVLSSEDPYLAAVGAGLDRPDAAARLRRLGVRWVLVERQTGGEEARPATVRTVTKGPWLWLVDLGRVEGSRRDRPDTWLVIIADGLSGALVLLASYGFRPGRGTVPPI